MSSSAGERGLETDTTKNLITHLYGVHIHISYIIYHIVCISAEIDVGVCFAVHTVTTTLCQG